MKSAVMLISMSIWLPLRAAAGSLSGTLAPALRAVEAIAIGLPAGQQGVVEEINEKLEELRYERADLIGDEDDGGGAE